MKNKVFFIVLSMLVLLTGVVVWYFFIGNTKIQKPLIPITLRLKWFHQSQFAGNYVAEQKGYYDAEGLKIIIKSNDFKSEPIDDVISGKADFGITGAENLIIARNKGQKVKALAVIYQESPVVAFSLNSSGINDPRDFIGKKIGIPKDLEPIIFTMLKAQGIDYKKDVKIIATDFGIDSLLEKKVDIGTGYATNETIQLEEAGKQINVFSPYKYGVKMYADVLFTTDEMIDKKPEVVAKFVLATLKGWEYALTHIDEAANLTLLYKDDNNKSLNFEHQKNLLKKSLLFIKPNINRKVGEMNYIDWKRTSELLVEAGITSGKIDVSEMYTTRFISK